MARHDYTYPSNFAAVWNRIRICELYRRTAAICQIDGIIVRLSRRARKAAVVAARDLGNPALAHAFRLDKLYRTRGGTGPGTGDDGEPDGGDDEGGDA